MMKKTWRIPAIAGVLVGLGLLAVAIWTRAGGVVVDRAAGASGVIPATSPSVPQAALSPERKRLEYDARVANLHNRIARLETLVDFLPPEAVDVEALGRSFGTPEAAFAYVRDGIALEPYAGVMKGSVATLTSRGGNAADRSILLAALLAQRGIQTRIAHGTLPDREAAALLQQIATRPGALEQIARVLPTSLPAVQLSAEEQQSVDAIIAQATARADQRRREADASSIEMRAALAQTGSEAGTVRGAAQLAALRDHFWVQVSLGGQTVDLDPAFASAQAGQRFAEPVETFSADHCPEALYHRFTIRVVADFLESGRLSRREIVGAAARAADLFNQNIRLAVLPQAITSAQNTYQASVTLGRAAPVARWFSLRSSAAEATPRSPAGAAGGLFGGLEAEPAAKPADAGGQEVLGRLTVEIVASAPVLGDATYRRVILDRLDGDEQAPRLLADLEADDSVRSLLVQVWDGTIAVGASHPLPMLTQRLETLTRQQPMWEQALAAKYFGQPFQSEPLAGLQPPGQIVGFFFQSALAHQAVAGRETPDVRLYHIRPQLAFARHGVGMDDWSKLISSRRFQDAIDLVNLPYGIVGSTEAASKLSLELGIADTTLERALAAEGTDFNTIPLMAAAREQAIAVLTVRPREPARIHQLQIPAPLRGVLLDELRRGRTLLVPTRLVTLNQVGTFGWWSIDPESGVPLGQMDLGAGQGSVESAKLTEATATMSHTIGKLYGGLVGCFFMEAGRQLGASGGRGFAIPATAAIHPDEPLVECISAKVCEATIEYAFLAGGVASFHHRNWYQEIGWVGLHMFGPAIVSHLSCH